MKSSRAPSKEELRLARGVFIKRLLSTLLLLPAWFAPHSAIRVFFHRLRGVRIGKGVEIGYFVIIGNVDPSKISIGDGATIAARSSILEHDNAMLYTARGTVVSGPTTIGRRAFVGIGAVILPGVTIGDQAIVGALSLVNSDVPSRQTYCGVPARPIVKRLGGVSNARAAG